MLETALPEYIAELFMPNILFCLFTSFILIGRTALVTIQLCHHRCHQNMLISSSFELRMNSEICQSNVPLYLLFYKLCTLMCLQNGPDFFKITLWNYTSMSGIRKIRIKYFHQETPKLNTYVWHKYGNNILIPKYAYLLKKITEMLSNEHPWVVSMMGELSP